MDNISIYSILPLLSSKAKDKLDSSARRSVLLNSVLLSQFGGSGNPIQGFLSSQQVVDKELAEQDKKEAEDGLRQLIARFLELNNESFNSIIGQQISAILDQIAKAMGDHPKIFDTIFINMIEAGENSGTLGLVLLRLADL